MNKKKIKQGDVYVSLTHIMMYSIAPTTKLEVATLNCSDSLIGLRSVEDESVFIYVTLEVLDRCFDKL